MNRRGFLGFFGGAAAAGPKLAAGIAENVAGMATIPPYPSIGMGAMTSANDDNCKASRIKELKAIISGRDPVEEQSNKMSRLYALEHGERLRLDSLRSISPSHKQRMLTDGAVDRQKRIRMADAEWDLKRLLTGN
jgi:hypothetical protein